MPKLAPAPRRTARTWSVALLAVGVIANLAVVAVQTLGDAKVISLISLAYLNSGLAFITGVARFLAQTILISTEEKVEIITATANAPMLPDQRNVAVTIEGSSIKTVV